jgi:UDP-2,3-diacylglucosamine hydrolase
VPAHRLVVVADAHLGAVPPDVEPRLLRFLEAVPTLGDALLVNGDLFEFWFGYGRVVPRHGFRVAAALAHIGARLPVTLVGGNHDRWDRGFWRDEAGLDFQPLRAELRVGGRRVLALHGDGLTDRRWTSRLLHRVVSHPATSAVYRALHPDLGLPLVHRLSPHLGDRDAGEAKSAAAATQQRAWAEAALRADSAPDVLVMGHTHRPALAEPVRGRWYLNPGAWFDGGRYAVVSESRIELGRFEGA